MFARHRAWLTAVLIGASATATLLWWFYPRPLFVHRLPESNFSFSGLQLEPGYVNPATYAHRARWLPIFCSGDKDSRCFYFLDQQDQRLIGPWLTPKATAAHHVDWQFDSRGRFLTVFDNNRFTSRPIEPIHWFNPRTSESGTIAIPVIPDKRKHQVSRDGSVIVITSGTNDGPVKITVFDLNSESITSSFKLPSPHSGLRTTSNTPATLGFDLSPDGAKLALTAPWNEDQRVGPFGIRIIDTRTGKLVRRITAGEDLTIESATAQRERSENDPAYPRESTNTGCTEPAFFLDGSGLYYRVIRRVKYEPDNGWQDGFYESKLINFDFEDGLIPGRSIWQGQYGPNFEEPYAVSNGMNGEHAIWMREFGDSKTIRITDANRTEITDWLALPADISSEYMDEFDGTLVPGTHGLVTTHYPDQDATRTQQFAQNLIDKIGLPLQVTPPGGDQAFWFNWKTGKWFAFRQTEPEYIDDYACQPGRVTLLIDKSGPNARIEVWEAPMRRTPITAIWLTGLAAAVGSLLYFRRRKAISTQPTNNVAAAD